MMAMHPIKAYSLDFNWAPTKEWGRYFAEPGRWAQADPAAHVAWYKTLGADVIQTFCVSCNGYAWYKNGAVPEQPGLRHDFLPEMVRLGHAEGMRVMGYFCMAANSKWGTDNPNLSYGTPATYHIPYTDDYLEYLSASIKDAVLKTGVDGLMIDWLWMPDRSSTHGRWLDCEKALFEQLMEIRFPGEGAMSEDLKRAYGRLAIERSWRHVRHAAKSANPNCLLWLTVNDPRHTHLVDSIPYAQTDWLMNEEGSLDDINDVREMVGDHTRLITCMAKWNGKDAAVVVPNAMAAGVGVYGFTAPATNDGLVPLAPILSRPIEDLSADERSIGVLARAYHGASLQSLWTGKRFVELDARKHA